MHWLSQKPRIISECNLRRTVLGATVASATSLSRNEIFGVYRVSKIISFSAISFCDNINIHGKRVFSASRHAHRYFLSFFSRPISVLSSVDAEEFPSFLVKNSMHPRVFSMKWVVVKSSNFLLSCNNDTKRCLNKRSLVSFRINMGKANLLAESYIPTPLRLLFQISK